LAEAVFALVAREGGAVGVIVGGGTEAGWVDAVTAARVVEPQNAALKWRMGVWPKAVRPMAMLLGSMFEAPTTAIICMNWLEPKLLTADQTREVLTRTPPVALPVSGSLLQ
jgi:hypothetical protein